MIFKTLESFPNKSFFCSGCQKLWVIQKFFPTVTKLNKINIKKKAKPILTFDLNT